MAEEDEHDESNEYEQGLIKDMPLAVQNIEHVAEEIERKVDSVKAEIGNLEKRIGGKLSDMDRQSDIRYNLLSAAIIIFGIGNCALTFGTHALKPKVQTANVMGAEALEKFYDIDGQRVYLEIDGQPVEQYVKRK